MGDGLVISKIGIAVAMLAVGSFIALDPAAAQGRQGGKNARNGGKQVGQVNRGNRVRPKQARAAAQSKKKKGWQRQVGRAVISAARVLASESRRGYRNRGYRERRRFDRSCVAVARRRGGYGRRIGIRAEGYGRRACQKAMRRCSRQLGFRKSRGRNPFAACVIARRG